MIRALILIVACLVATELAFGEGNARLCYNAHKQCFTDLTRYEIQGPDHVLPSETRELFGDYSTQSPALNPIQPCSYKLGSGI